MDPSVSALSATSLPLQGLERSREQAGSFQQPQVSRDTRGAAGGQDAPVGDRGSGPAYCPRGSLSQVHPSSFL